MTEAQKAAQQRFKKAVKLANEMRAKNKKLTHTEAVKKAFAQIGSAPKKKAAPAKKAAKAAPAKKAAKKAPAKKAAAKKCVTDHRDTKSHNVNIRVVSGTAYLGNKKFYPNAIDRKYTMSEIKKIQPFRFEKLPNEKKEFKLITVKYKSGYKKQFLIEKKLTKNLKNQTVKKFIVYNIDALGQMKDIFYVTNDIKLLSEKIGKKVTF